MKDMEARKHEGFIKVVMSKTGYEKKKKVSISKARSLIHSGTKIKVSKPQQTVTVLYSRGISLRFSCQ